MRVEKPATKGARALWLDWWPPALIAIVVLAVWLFGAGRLVQWAVPAMFAAPLTLLAALTMFLLPGLALLGLLWPTALAPAERWALALGVSYALPPLLLLLSAPLGIRW